jgi:hypothetical protein
MEYDFNRPFFEQFSELYNNVPVSATILAHTENCVYNMYVGKSKDCYLSSRCGYCTDVYYSNNIIHCNFIVDCLYMYQSEMCYNCINCTTATKCVECFSCENINDCYYLYDCKNCRDCIACTGLVDKQYCVANEQLTEEEYRQHLVKLQSSERSSYQHYQILFTTVLKAYLFKYADNFGNEHVTGDTIENCNNVYSSYNIHDVQDACNCWECEDSNSLYGAVFANKCERCVELMDGWYSYDAYFSSLVVESNNIFYSAYAFNNSANLFGCVCTKHHEYCILNKQYTKEEYELLAPKIIEHMKSTGEWGQFFPPNISHFAYNETVAYDYFPLTKKQTLARGWHWHDDPVPDMNFTPMEIPNTIDEVPDVVVDHALICTKSGKPFKVLEKELWFYRQMRLPLPMLCPKQRFYEQFAKLNERKLYDRHCHKCKAGVESPHATDSGKSVLCEACYLDERY